MRLLRLEAYLELLKPAELRVMAQHLGFKQPDIHRERMSAFICSALREPASLRSALKELGEGELVILDYIVTRGLIFFELREVPHLLRHIKLKGDPVRPIERLGQLGVLFPLEARGRAPFLSVPRELHNEIARFLNDSGYYCPAPAEAPPEMVVSHGLDLLRDLYACLAFMRQEGEVRLTQKGMVMKRTYDRLAKGLARSQEDFPLESQPWGLPVFPDRFSLLTGYLLDRGLWQSQRDRWVPGERQTAWLALPYLAQLEDLFAYLYQKYVRRGTGAYQNVSLYLLNALKRFELDRWYPVTALSEQMLAYPSDGRAGLDPEILSAACQGLLRVLMYLGMVELGGTKGKPRATHFRLSSRYAHVSGLQRLESLGGERTTEGGLVVQPNFELVVFSEADLSVGLGLARFCELISADRVAHYRITRESAYRAMEEG
ncbi:MAG: hypothetical protein HYY20_03705, partial [Candidatus Tectomicrobia bacterium]|nr:hypothetical protein [Candidatus Tectomicrobia bacterium]